MQIGIVGLGKMGLNLTKNLIDKNYSVIGYDKHTVVTDLSEGKGFKQEKTLESMVNSMSSPRKIWLLVPAGSVTENVIDELINYLQPGDYLIDGGNSNYHDTIRRASKLHTN